MLVCTFLRGELYEFARTKAPLVKGSWPEGPEGLARRSKKAADLSAAFSSLYLYTFYAYS